MLHQDSISPELLEMGNNLLDKIERARNPAKEYNLMSRIKELTEENDGEWR